MVEVQGNKTSDTDNIFKDINKENIFNLWKRGPKVNFKTA